MLSFAAYSRDQEGTPRARPVCRRHPGEPHEFLGDDGPLATRGDALSRRSIYAVRIFRATGAWAGMYRLTLASAFRCLQGVLDAAEQISRPPLLTKLMEPLRPNSLAATVGKLNECLDKAVLSFQVSAIQRPFNLLQVADQIISFPIS